MDDMHYACGKAGRGQITEYLAAMTKHVSATGEETGFVLLTAGPLTLRTVPVIIDSHETWVEKILFWVKF